MIDFAVRTRTDPVPAAERARLLEAPGFGQVFTDHMVTIRWSADAGWHDARLEPFGPLTLSPATAVFHYGQEIFEGLKAYRQAAGPIVTFRPAENAARFNRSAARMSMPELPAEAFIRAIELLVTQDRDWVPAREGDSLYLRPFMIATSPAIGISKPSQTYLFVLIASPAGSYFGGALQPVTVWLEREYTRAAPGGTGAAKTGGNYAGGFSGQLRALEHDCQQVVWLDAVEHQWVEEMGGMNLFFVYGSGADARIVTPPLTGTLLPGVTRDALLALAPSMGISASQEPVSVQQWHTQSESGELSETFACGTAAVVTPVGAVKGASEQWTIGDGGCGPVTRKLFDELLAIQYGHRPDTHGWIHKII